MAELDRTRSKAVGVRRWLTAKIIAYLQTPLPRYERRTPADLDALRRHIRRCDVLLVEGEQRVSAIIRYLTQSSWSHAALYIGDELVRRGGRLGDQVREQFGAEADSLLVEALPEGVIASPLAKYAEMNVRLCRPHGLRRDDASIIIDEAIATIGWRYDLRNVFDLARYLIPVGLVPNRFREAALHYGSGRPTEVICSSLVGRLFQRVGFPILPTRVGDSSPLLARRSRLIDRILGHRSREYTGLFRMRHPTLLTPRDFDLSPYFDVIKFNQLAEGGFDYRSMRWVRENGLLDAESSDEDAQPQADLEPLREASARDC